MILKLDKIGGSMLVQYHTGRCDTNAERKGMPSVSCKMCAACDCAARKFENLAQYPLDLQAAPLSARATDCLKLVCLVLRTLEASH